MTEIRTSCPGDMEDILALEEDCFRPPWTERSLTGELADPEGLMLTAENGGRFAGFCMIHRAGDQAELYQIAVRPEERRSGVATELMLVAESWARNGGMTGMFLEVRASNAAAAGLYEKVGWRRIGLRKRYYVDPAEDALLYGKELNE